MGDVLYFVIPCYYDEDTLPVTAPVVEEKLRSLIERGKVSPESRVLLVNDGSTDGTWDVIKSLHDSSPMIVGLDLARNSGAQNAMLAGLSYARRHADLTITMDSDLQDDIGAVDEMVDRYLAGCNMVFGVRKARDNDGFFEKFTSEAFYSFMGRFNPRLIREHANYRLMDRKAVDLLMEYNEESFFMPVLTASLGLKTAVVYHERFPRAAGTSNYNFRRRLRLGIDAALSHTSAPVKLFSVFAAVSLLLFFVSLGFFIASSVNRGAFDAGLCIVTSLMLICFILNACLRILGEYLYKIFMQSKRRPLYQIGEILE